MRQTHYEPLPGVATCIHGERQDRTTSDGKPICALCRRADSLRYVPTVDYQALQAGDLLDADDPDDNTAPAACRVESLMIEWDMTRKPAPAGTLF